MKSIEAYKKILIQVWKKNFPDLDEKEFRETLEDEEEIVAKTILEAMQQAVNAKLEEAIEKIDKDIESPIDEWHDAFNAGMQGAKNIIKKSKLP